ncbi:MAG: GntR family transcriptional regulator, partial [Cetobacterium sp.]
MAKSRYLEIYNFIKENIDNGTYPPEEKIPSENQLKDIFSVSRNTVRKAIELLSSNGYLSSVHGKGVFVIKKIPVNFLLGGTESFKEASLKNGLNYKTTVPVFESLIVDEEISKKTHFLIGEEVYHMIRIREINNEKVILDDNYFLKEVVDGLTVSIAMDSIYEFLEKT